MATFKKSQAKDAVIERNVKRANKVRAKKLQSASHLQTPVLSTNSDSSLFDSYYQSRTEVDHQHPYSQKPRPITQQLPTLSNQNSYYLPTEFSAANSSMLHKGPTRLGSQQQSHNNSVQAGKEFNVFSTTQTSALWHAQQHQKRRSASQRVDASDQLQRERSKTIKTESSEQTDYKSNKQIDRMSSNKVARPGINPQPVTVRALVDTKK